VDFFQHPGGKKKGFFFFKKNKIFTPPPPPPHIMRFFDISMQISHFPGVCCEKAGFLEAVPKLQFWNSYLEFSGKTGL
jgi:hypothetical protein